MRRSLNYLTAFREYFILLGTLIFSLFLILSNDNPQIQVLRRTALGVVATINRGLAWYPQLVTKVQENDRLKKRNVELASENNILKEAMAENIHLRELLQFKQNTLFQTVFVKVVGRNTGGIVNGIMLEGGTNQGIKKNMPIITDQGLVGKIISASSNYSLAQIMTDRNFHLSSKIQRTRVLGILRWKHDQIFSLNEVPKAMDVQVGDVVITSGFSSIFPENIKIGVVVKVSDQIPGLFKDVTVIPSVDLNQVEDVFVITNAAKQFPDFSPYAPPSFSEQ